MADQGQERGSDCSEMMQRLKAVWRTDKVVDVYNHWALHGYDEMFSEGKPSLFKALGALEELFPLESRAKVTLLDVGAGTGLAGQKLRDVGFTTLDGLDPAQEMLRVAENKKVYRNLYCCGLGEEPLAIPAEVYDAVSMIGVLGHVNVKPHAVEDLLRFVKPGGFLVITMFSLHLQDNPHFRQNWEPMVARLQAEKKWEVIKMDRYKDDKLGSEGILMVFRVL